MHYQPTSTSALTRFLVTAVSLIAFAIVGAFPLTAQPLIWTGSQSSNWDSTAQNNWQRNGAAAAYADGADVVFNNSSTTSTIGIPATVAPGSVTVDVTRDLSLATTTAYYIGGSGVITKRGTGSLVFTNHNGAARGAAGSFSGTTVIEEGVLQMYMKADNNYTTIGSVVIAGGTLSHTRYTSGEVNMSGMPIHVPEGTSGAFIMDTNARILKFTVTLTGGGTLTINPNSNNNTNGGNFQMLDTNMDGFTGEMRFVSPVLRTVTNRPNGRAPSFEGTTLHLDNVTMAQYNTNAANFKTLTIGALSSSGTFARLTAVAQSPGTNYIIGGKNLSTTYGGDFADASSSNRAHITKVGTGMLTLSGTTAHTGSTSVQAGALNISGAFTGASAITVAAAASFGGSGKVAGTVALADGATLLADATSGMLDGIEVGGAATFGATLKVSAVVAPGQLVAGGTFALLKAASIAGTPVITYVGPDLGGTVTFGQSGGVITGTLMPPAPAITSGLAASGTAGMPFSYQIAATNRPTGYSATNLPEGLTLNTSTGLISGISRTPAITNVTIGVSNFGGGDTKTLTIDMLAPPPTTSVPEIISPLEVSTNAGDAFSYQVVATQVPIISYSATPLPPGLAFNTTTGVLSGAVTEGDTYNIALTVTNDRGPGTATLVLKAYATPVITSATTAEGTVGQPFNYAIVATGVPTSYAASPIPSGLSFDAATGIISGTPTVTGTTTVALSVANSIGSDQKDLVITIDTRAPVIDSPLRATGTIGLPMNYQITASNNPTSYTADPLPPGFSFNTVSGVISGTPATTGALGTVMISATNFYGSDTRALNLYAVTPSPAGVLVWTGKTNSDWDTATQNWTRDGADTTYADNSTVLFNDASLTETVSVTVPVSPKAVTVDVAGSLTITPLSGTLAPASGAGFTGTGSIVKTGDGTLVFGGPSAVTSGSFAGVTTLKAGVTQYYMAAGVSPSMGTTVLAGGTLTHTKLSSGETVFNKHPMNVPEGEAGVFATNALGTRVLKFGVILGGSGTLSIVADGDKLQFLDTDFSGFKGTLRLASSSTTARAMQNRPSNVPTALDNTTLVLDNVMLEQYAGMGPSTINIGALVGSGSARLKATNIAGGTKYVVGGKNLDTTYDGEILDNGEGYASLVKVGTGMLTLTNGVIFSGLASVEAGALNVTGLIDSGSTITVSSSAAFGGSGFVVNDVEYADGATLLVGTYVSGSLLGPEVIVGNVTLGSKLYVSAVVPEGRALRAGEQTFTVLRTFADYIYGTPEIIWTGPQVEGEVVFNQMADKITATIKVPNTPAITSGLSVTGTAGLPFSYQIVATNNPTSYSAAGLPDGLTIDPLSGAISGQLFGTPDAVSTYNVTIKAINLGGTGTQTLVINVVAPATPGTAPSITSPLTASGIVGKPFAYRITALPGLITSFGATGLPAGLSFDPETGIISGEIASAGITNVTISATNSVGTGTAVLKIGGYEVPAITSDLYVTGTVGAPFNYQIAASGAPSSFDAEPLPEGLSINHGSGAITGTPTAAGTTYATISGANPAVGGADVLTIVIIDQPPASALVWTGAVDGNWDTTTLNWTRNGVPSAYSDGADVYFDDAPINRTVTVTGTYVPGSLTFNNGAAAVTIITSASTTINGAYPMTKNGNGSVIFPAAVSGWTGVQTLNAGMVKRYQNFAGSIVFNSGTMALNYTDTSGGAGGDTLAYFVDEGKTGVFDFRERNRFQLRGKPMGSGTLTLKYLVSGDRADVQKFHPNEFTGTFIVEGDGGMRIAADVITTFDWASFVNTTLMLEKATIVQPQTGSGGNTWHIGALGGSSNRVWLRGGNPGVITYRVGAKNIDTTFAGNIGDYQDTVSSRSVNASLRKVGTGMLTLTGSLNYANNTFVDAGGLRMTTRHDGAGSITVGGSAAFGGSAMLTPTVTFEDGAQLLIDADPETGELSGPTASNAITFEGGSLKVRPVVAEGGRITNGIYTLLVSDYDFSSLPALEWAWSGTPAAQGALEYVGRNQIRVTVTGGAIPRPKITSVLVAEAVVGQPFSYTLTATRDLVEPTQFSVVGRLPVGLNFDTTTGVLSGVFTDAGEQIVSLRAYNSSGTSTAMLRVFIYDTMPPAPVITSGTYMITQRGRKMSYQITTDRPVSSYTVGALPAGVSFNTSTGVIAGLPEQIATTHIPLTVSNLGGTGTSSLELVVTYPRPAKLGVSSTTTVQNEGFVWQTEWLNEPMGMSLAGFNEYIGNTAGNPATYLQISSTSVITGTDGTNTAACVITGTFPNVATTGTVALTVNGTMFAWNLSGTSTYQMKITVNPPTPVVLNPERYTFTVGVPLDPEATKILSTNMYPAYMRTYGVTNIPNGLNVDPKTGAISGAPLVGGVFEVAFVASNITGSGSKLVIITINGASYLTTLAGKAGEPGAADGPSDQARFNAPGGGAVGKDGSLYVVDTSNGSIRKIAPNGMVSTLATGLGEPAAAVMDKAGTTLYVLDKVGNAIKKVDVATGAVTPLAVNGTPALNAPKGLVIDDSGNLYVADTGNNLIRKIVASSGVMTTIAGTGTPGADNGAGASATFNEPEGIAIDAAGKHLYIADTNNHIIRAIDIEAAQVTTLAGITGDAGSNSGETGARFNSPTGLTLDPVGVLLVADTGNHTIRALDTSTGSVITFAGAPEEPGVTDGSAIQSMLNAPRGVSIDYVNGEIYVFDTGNNTVRVLQIGPSILRPPADQYVKLNSTGTFAVVATGAPLPTYQWYRNGIIMGSATNALVSVEGVKLTDVGHYSVEITNPLGTRVTSAFLGVSDASPNNPDDSKGVGGSGGGGGGGGAPSVWYLSILAALFVFRRMRRSSILLLVVVGLSVLQPFSPSAFSQATARGTITGRVVNQATGQYLQNALVTVEGTNIEALTDNTGSYRIINVPAGAVRLTASYSGLDKITQAITVTADGASNADFNLTAQVYQMEKFVVAGDREGSARIVQEQHMSATQKAMFAADSFGNIIDSNFGELMKNLPGVTLNYDGEDASTMSIRGMDPESISVTLDGNSVATAGIDGENVQGGASESRAFNLKTVGLENIESITIVIAPTPDMPANSMGGAVEITTKSALNQRGRRVTFNTNLSLNTAELDLKKTPGGARTPTRKIQPGFSFSWSEAYGKKQRIGVALSASFSRNYRYSNEYGLPGKGDSIYTYNRESLVDNAVVPASTGYVNQLQWTERGGQSQNRMLSLNLDYQPFGKNHTFSLKTSVNDVQGVGAYSRFMNVTAGVRGDGSSLDTMISPTGATVKMGNSVTSPNNRNYSLNFVGKHRFGNWNLDYSASYSRAEVNPKPEDNYRIEYNSTGYGLNIFELSGNGTGRIVQTSDNGQGIVAADDPRSYQNIENYGNLTMYQSMRSTVRENRGAKVNLTLPPLVIPFFFKHSIPVSVKIGASYGETMLDTSQFSRTRRMTGGLNQPNFGTPAEPALSEFADPYFKNSWGFGVPIPQWVNPHSIYEYLQATPQAFYTKMENTTGDLYAELRGAKYSKETTSAAYFMLTVRLLRSLTMTTGMRFEQSVQSGWGPNYEKWNSTLFATGEKFDTVSPKIQGPDFHPINNPFDFIDNPNYGASFDDKMRLLFTKEYYSKTNKTKSHPNIQFRWTPHKDVNVRFAWTQNIGKPPFGKMLADSVWDSDYRTISRGNPQLKPETSYKYDVALEWYPGNGALLTLSLFQQKMQNIIENDLTFIHVTGDPELATVTEVSENSTADDYIYRESQPAGIWAITTPRNIGEGSNEGFELAYRQKLGFIHSSLRNVEVYAVYSYADPIRQVRRHTMSKPTSGVSQDIMLEYLLSPMILETVPRNNIKKHTGNLQLRYNGKRWSGKIAGYWEDRFVRAVKSDPFEITWQNESIRFDLSIGFKISSHWRASFDWRNMTKVGDDRKIYDRTGGYFTAGTVVNLGLNANF